jgi:predicted Fe-Mo cluster-binding NifX family protein
MQQRILIPILDNEIAPRFDLATDVLIVTLVWVDGRIVDREDKVVVLDHPSPEAVCRLVIVHTVNTVICGGIEGEYYDFLEWKGAQVLDDVVGSTADVMNVFLAGELESGMILRREDNG